MLPAEFIQTGSAKPIKRAKRNINGVLLLDKPYGISSNKALQRVKFNFSANKSGHTGTLDPMATGLLPICLGEATKFSSVLLGADKTYEAILRLGFMSTTGDAEGEITQLTTNTRQFNRLEYEDILRQFIGKISQVPPMYSALKYHGKPLYVYARSGEVIERPPREISIYGIKINSVVDDELHITVHCGTGTYIRTLAEDIGKALGYGGAYLIKLRRLAIDRFNLSQAQTITVLETMSLTERDNCLLPIDSLLQQFTAVTLDQSATLNLIQGRSISALPAAGSLTAGTVVRLYDPQQQFFGLGEVTSEQKIIPKRLLANSLCLDK